VMRVESFPVACGEFIDISDVEKEELEKPGFALVPEGFRYREDMFAARLRGDSMTPRFNDREWGLSFWTLEVRGGIASFLWSIGGRA